MPIHDAVGNVKPTGPVGPAKVRWTYLRPYGSGDRYSADLYASDSSDSLYFLKVGEPLTWEAKDGTLNLDFDRAELDQMIAELTWLRDNWGKVGRDAD
jgi:hypothetical protein